MRVRDLLKQKPSTVITVEPGTELGVVTHLLIEHGIGGVPVVSPTGTAVGFVAERDIVRAMDEHPDGIRHLKVESVMRRPAPTCSAWPCTCRTTRGAPGVRQRSFMKDGWTTNRRWRAT